MADNFASGFAQGLASVAQLGAAIENIQASRERREQIREDRARALEDREFNQLGGLLDALATDSETGLRDSTRLTTPGAQQRITEFLQGAPRLRRLISERLTPGSPAEAQGYTREVVGVAPVPDGNGGVRTDVMAVRVQWKDKDGKVVSDGPMTANGTNQPQDQVVLISGDEFASSALDLAMARNPDLREKFLKDTQSRRVTGALTDALRRVHQEAQNAGQGPRYVAAGGAAPGLRAAATPMGNAPAMAMPEAWAPSAPTTPARSKSPVRQDDDNYPGATVLEPWEPYSWEESESGESTPAAEAAPPAPAPAPVAPPVLSPAAQASAPVPSAPQVRQAATELVAAAQNAGRGAPKMTDQDIKNLVTLVQAKAVDLDQAERMLRTGRFTPKVKSAVATEVGALLVSDDGEVTEHVSPTLLGLKQGESAARQLGRVDDHRKAQAKAVGEFIDRVLPGQDNAALRPRLMQQVTATSQALGWDTADPAWQGVMAGAYTDFSNYYEQNNGLITRLFGEQPIKSFTPFVVARYYGVDPTRVIEDAVLPVRRTLASSAFLGTPNVILSDRELAWITQVAAKAMRDGQNPLVLTQEMAKTIIADRKQR